jgi:hypothetical protein
MKKRVNIGNIIEFREEDDDIVRISVRTPNNWIEYYGRDTIESHCWSWSAPGNNPNTELPLNSELEEFKEDMLFKKTDIIDLYEYISYTEEEDWASKKPFTIKSLKTDGKVYYISVFPIQPYENKTKIALRIAKYQYQPSMERAVANVLFPLSYQLHLQYRMSKFLFDIYI